MSDHDVFHINNDNSALDHFHVVLNESIDKYLNDPGRVHNVVIAKLIDAGHQYLHGSADDRGLIDATVREFAAFIASGRADDAPFVSACRNLAGNGTDDG
jgi:hypothetical protein